MNFKHILLPVAMVLTLLASCVSDDSTYGTPGKTFIRLSGIAESYSIASYSSEKLVIKPQISSSFDDNDLEYLWTYYLASKGTESTYDPNTNTTTYPKADTLSHNRDLDMPVGLPDGNYKLIYTVTSKSTGYSQHFVTALNTASALAEGFYVLKENSEGNTDLDLYNPSKKSLVSNVLQTYQGKAMPGAPRCMDVIYNMSYVDAQGNPAGANMLCLTTEADSMRFMSLQDGRTVVSPVNAHYDPVKGEIPYRTVRGWYSIYYLTSNGVYSCYTGSTGIFAFANGDPASVHVASGGNASFYAICYWSPTAHSIEALDYNGTSMPVISAVPGYEATNLQATCLDCGFCEAAGGKTYFLLQDNNDASKKLLYAIDCAMTKATISSVRAISPDSHFAKASLRAFNSRTATIGYAVDDNKLYSYNLVQEETEKQLSLQGIPADEKITFVSNRYFAGSSSFDYLIIGTQKSGTYHLYFYNMVGGEPTGVPAFTISGEGKLKSLGYVNPLVKEGDDATLLPILDE